MAGKLIPMVRANAKHAPVSPDPQESARCEAERALREDASAMQRLAAGEIAALGEIYDRHHVAVRRFVARATGDPDETEDLVHATFMTVRDIAVWFDVERPCRAWLFGVAARLIRRHHATRARWTRLLRTFGTSHYSSPDPESRLAARSDLGKVALALEQMSDAKRLVVVMAELEGMSCEEIAAALEIPIGTVWTRLHHARKGLLAAVGNGGVE